MPAEGSGSGRSMFSRCHDAYQRVRAHMRRPEEDSDTDVTHKSMTFAVLVGTSLGHLVAAWAGWAAPWVRYGQASAAVLSMLSAGALWTTRRLSKSGMRVLMAMWLACISVTDLGGAPLGKEYWPLFVLLVDYLLVVRAERWLTGAVVAYVLVWITVKQIEEAFRFGLYDYPGAWGYDDRQARFCGCERPPCSLEGQDGTFEALLSLPVSLVPVLTVFCVDFFLTRGFADQVAAEQARMQRAVRTTETVAAYLARYDLDAADAALALDDGLLPEELLLSFRALLANLGAYRAYLPQEFFRDDAASTPFSRRGSDADVPGLASPQVAVVFTDIRSSTMLWEASGEAMHAALATHNKIMRAAIAAYRGYEVKTIGDAFMVAFHSAWDATQFALDVQAELADEGLWPEGLTRPTAGDGFHMLTVRIGVHCAATGGSGDEVRAEANVLTGRYDYFGRAVNKAARVEPQGCPGAVTVTDAVMEALAGRQDEVAGRAWVYPYSHVREGKGLAEPLRLTLLLPKAARYLQRKAEEFAWQAAEAPVSPVLPGAAASSLLTAGTPSACVGMVNYGAAAADPPARLEALHQHLEATHGHITSVVCHTALVSWGVHRRCRRRVGMAIKFFVGLYTAWGGGGGAPFHAGLAVGAVESQSLVASFEQRFVTLVGTAVEAAGALCVGAAELAACVLAAGTGPLDDVFTQIRGLRGRVRPVDEWAVAGADGEAVAVYEVWVAALAGGDDAARWPAQYSLAHRARDAQLLLDLSLDDPDDGVLAAVARMIAASDHLPHAAVRLRRPRGAAGLAVETLSPQSLISAPYPSADASTPSPVPTLVVEWP